MKGYEALYAVNKNGDIFSFKSKKFLKQSISGSGYYFVTLCNGVAKEQKQISIHRIMATTFLGLTNDLQVDHKDFNKKNNSLSNLEVVTRKENMIRAWRAGRTPQPPRHDGEKNPRAKLTKNQVNKLRRMKFKYGDKIKLSKILGITVEQICNIVAKRSWKQTRARRYDNA